MDVVLPDTYEIEFLPEVMKIESKFGNYSLEIEKTETNKLKLKRRLTINSGNYSKEEYEEYRIFREKIAKNDNSKIVLTQKKI